MRTLLEIKDDGSVAIQYEDNGVVATKDVTLGDVAKLFYDLLKDEMAVQGKWFATPLLPPEILAYQSTVNGANIHVALSWGPESVPFAYAKTLFQAIPFPRLVFNLHLGFDEKSSEYRFINTQVAAVLEKGRLNRDTPLYHYPFSHVAGTYMCTGTAVFPIFKTFEEAVAKLPRFILSIPNGDDDYDAKQVNNSRLSLRELLQTLDGEDEFPGEWLKPLDMTLQDFIYPKYH